VWSGRRVGVHSWIRTGSQRPERLGVRATDGLNGGPRSERGRGHVGAGSACREGFSRVG
jgi:hypothetical protein